MKKIFSLLALALPLVMTSCLKDEVYVGPPSIDKIDLSPKMGSITPDNDVTVTVTVTDKNSEIKAVSLKYAVSGGAEQSLSMTKGASEYTAIIPRQAENAEVEYYVTAENVLGKVVTSPKSKYSVSWIQIEYGTLRDIILSEVNCSSKFIEIFNPSDKPVDLGGLRFAKNGTASYFARTDQASGVANGVILEPGQYGVFGCKNFSTTEIAEGAILIGESGTGLSGGKSVLVILQDEEGNNLDYFVNVADDGHSPDDACWDSAMEKEFTGSVSRFSENGKWEWYVSDITCGAANAKADGAFKYVNTIDFGAQPAAAIFNVAHSPAAPTKDNEVVVSATVPNAVSVTLSYVVGDAAAVTAAMTAGEDDIYTATIPAQAAEVVVKYTISAVGLDGGTVTSEEKTYTVLGEEIEYDYTKLVLNELNGNAKYIEIYNAGDIEIDLADCVIRKDNDETTDFVIPSVKVAAKGYQVVACKKYSGTLTDIPTSPNGLSAKSELTIELFAPDGTSIDKFYTANTVENTLASYSRVPDGDGEWYYAEPTEGAANGISTGVIGTDMKLVLNELSGTDKKMELYNGGDADINLAGYTIEKDEEVKWTGTDEVIKAGEYLVFTFDKKKSGSCIVSSGFSGGKSVSLVLKDAEGKEVDAFIRGRKTPAAEGEAAAWGNQTLEEKTEYSFSRMNAGSWRYAAATLGAANGEAAAEIANK